MEGLPTFDVLSAPFGKEDTLRPTFLKYKSLTDINFQTGIPAAFSVPKGNGGVRFTRHMMNELGYLSTLGTYMDQIGYRPFWNKELSDAIGGYPKNAVLYYKKMINENDGSGGVKRSFYSLRRIISLIDNNTYDPAGGYIDGEHWQFIYEHLEWGFFPDYSKCTVLEDKTLEDQNETYTSSSYEFDTFCWLYLERTYSKWNTVDAWPASWNDLNSIVYIESYPLQSEVTVEWDTLSSMPAAVGATCGHIVPVTPGRKFRLCVRYGKNTNLGKLTVKLKKYEIQSAVS